MNALFRIAQIALAVLAFAGGAYKIFAFDQIASMPAMGALPYGAWVAVGVLEIVCALLLIIPAAAKRMPVLTPLAATVLALESLGLAVLYARHSLQLTAANPLVWVILIAVLAAFVAYGRSAPRALA